MNAEANPQEEHTQQEKNIEDEPSGLSIEEATIRQKKQPEVIVEKRPDVHYTGFDRPFHPLQIVSWVVFFFYLLTYYFINMVSL